MREKLQERLKELNSVIDQSKAQCEQMLANHNSLIGRRDEIAFQLSTCTDEVKLEEVKCAVVENPIEDCA
jgi:uncharacterized coiled-coil DUF342 family protein